MKRIFFYAIVFHIISSCNGLDNSHSIYPLEEDVSTIDGIIAASYDVVSGEKGSPRNWERDRSLHHPNAIYSYKPRGSSKQITFTLSDFHKDTDEIISQSGFYESEIDREVMTFGNMAHVWSTYETRESLGGSVVQRGINSIQLYNDENRWWIISWIFDRETPLNPLSGKSQNPIKK